MKSTVTIYEHGQIKTQYDVVGHQNAMASALVHLAREMEMNITRLGQDCVVTCTHLSPTEWSCTVESKDDEVYGLTVGRAI